MTMRRIIAFTVFGFLIISCKNDDDAAPPPVPPRPLAEVAAEDEAKIQEYLKTHYYNYQEFDSVSENFDFQIKVQKIPEGNTSLKPLSDYVDSLVIEVPPNYFLLEGDESISHKLYYLKAREGVGEVLTVADSAFVRYEGSLLDGTVFDGNNKEFPVWFDLPSLQTPSSPRNPGTAARGFAEGIPNFKTGSAPVVNDDGTFSVNGYGVGLIIFPSGLGYYNALRGSIPAYSPLVFKIDLYAMNETDHDRDGTISILEDANGDGYLWNDDTDGNGVPDYLDPNTK
ncbi:FKBP-type peptidyl-prolyl cis-trans isomerase [Pricia sp.]|uniref:FKBP-type peptidyl-prolyl cis-trans isomerase n=1 Tax=Pricia sp. TaxID=2268138 RepID=UPI0035935386